MPPNARLAGIAHAYWEATVADDPVFASTLGDDRHNDRWEDLSESGIAARTASIERFLHELADVPRDALNEEDRVTYDVLCHTLRESIEETKLRPWESSFNQFLGFHIEIPRVISEFPFATARHFDDYIKRLEAFPTLVQQHIDAARKGIASGVVPPRYLLEKTVGQVEKLIADPSPFLAPLESLPEGMMDADAARVGARIRQAVDIHVLAGYRQLLEFLNEEYVPAGRADPGLWATPGGDERYAFCVRQHTTTNMTPEEIHDLGRREVTRIETEMAAIGIKLGYPDLATFRQAVGEMEAYKPKSGDEILARYRRYIDEIASELPRLFGRLPKAPFKVKEIEPFRAAEAAGAEYYPPAADGSRPGSLYVNTSDPEQRTLISAESTAYHEGLPGHHMQIAIAQEAEGLPEFRKHAWSVAYGEGWALYCETLAKDIGRYTDPISDYGRLSDEILRAVRLVVDTGVHSKHWTRDQMVEYFRAHSTGDEISIQSEVDRYIAWPGQALGYKIGQLKLRELCQRARTELGDRFDIRKFHDLVLAGGTMPLAILERRVDAWIASGSR